MRGVDCNEVLFNCRATAVSQRARPAGRSGRPTFRPPVMTLCCFWISARCVKNSIQTASKRRMTCCLTGGSRPAGRQSQARPVRLTFRPPAAPGRLGPAGRRPARPAAGRRPARPASRARRGHRRPLACGFTARRARPPGRRPARPRARPPARQKLSARLYPQGEGRRGQCCARWSQVN